MKDYIYPVFLLVLGISLNFYWMFAGIDKLWLSLLVFASAITNIGTAAAQLRLLRRPGGREHVRALFKA